MTLLNRQEQKQAYLEAEQSMGFLKGFGPADSFFDEVDNNHAMFQARAQLSKVIAEIEACRKNPSLGRYHSYKTCWLNLDEWLEAAKKELEL